jgi:hypothetical protein
MIVVAIVALDLGAIRAAFDLESPSVLLTFAAILPMANILAVVLLLASLRPRSRPFLRGFVLFGAIALALFLVGGMRAVGLLELYLGPAISLDIAVMGPPPPISPIRPSYRLLVGLGILSFWATWPQLVFALMGGFLYRRPEATGRPARTHG